MIHAFSNDFKDLQVFSIFCSVIMRQELKDQFKSQIRWMINIQLIIIRRLMKAFLVIICLLLIAFCQTPQENEEPIQAEGQTLPPPPAEMNHQQKRGPRPTLNGVETSPRDMNDQAGKMNQDGKNSQRQNREHPRREPPKDIVQDESDIEVPEQSPKHNKNNENTRDQGQKSERPRPQYRDERSSQNKEKRRPEGKGPREEGMKQRPEKEGRQEGKDQRQMRRPPRMDDGRQFRGEWTEQQKKEYEERRKVMEQQMNKHREEMRKKREEMQQARRKELENEIQEKQKRKANGEKQPEPQKPRFVQHRERMEKEREEERKKRMESKNKVGNHERKHGKDSEKPKERDGKEPREKEISTNTEEEQFYTEFNIPAEPKGEGVVDVKVQSIELSNLSTAAP